MIFIGIGSNLKSETYGPPISNCEAAFEQISQNRVDILRQSSWYETVPIPASTQQNFVNGVVAVKTNLDSSQLLDVLLAIEIEMGRQRLEPNAARIIDLDLLSFNAKIIDSDRLTLPHPRLTERAFVVQPIAEIAPDWRHPISGLLITEILASLTDQDIKLISA
ncbi:MAG: 2-amino-4-hydroxy-6-hydroxymethyldihydropteridine diphosphokinase [Rhodospirillales bacterium]|jgi:2-amino-4-hydroxy-6-hydroxymethyldihydropteridine diphosphokinase|nr:2-amino-4-hydroxy-6-hydroxymethyldihydropteridine diphosphokinase [Rhodospirillales bacterium]